MSTRQFDLFDQEANQASDPEPEKPKEKKEKKEKKTGEEVDWESVPNHVLVAAATSDSVYEVEAHQGTCTCSTPDKPCVHIKRVIDVYGQKCKRSKYDMVSAMHKEIRRGDLESALYWADMLSLDDNWYVKFYTRQIIGEESRVFDLYHMAIEPKEYTYRDFVAFLTQSRKKWEHPKAYDAFLLQMESHAQVGELERTAMPHVCNYFKQALQKEDWRQAFRCFWGAWCQEPDEGIDEHWAQMDEILAESCKGLPKINEPYEVLRKYRQATKRDCFEIRVHLLEARMGALILDQEDYIWQKNRIVSHREHRVLRQVPLYAFDVHNYRGRKLIEQYGKHVAPNISSTKIDLRWSGMCCSTAWRYAAFKQYGLNYVNKLWGSVDLDMRFWNLALDFNEDRALLLGEVAL